jgi:hypothetical protein
MKSNVLNKLFTKGRRGNPLDRIGVLEKQNNAHFLANAVLEETEEMPIEPPTTIVNIEEFIIPTNLDSDSATEPTDAFFSGLAMGINGWSFGATAYYFATVALGVLQVGIDAVGKMFAGAGAVILDVLGISITQSTADGGADVNAYKFIDGGGVVKGGLYGYVYGGLNYVELKGDNIIFDAMTVKGLDASFVTYTPDSSTDWTGSTDPGNVDGALDQLAARLTDEELRVYDATDVTFAPASSTDWAGSTDPGDVDDALDQLAERVTDVETTPAGIPEAPNDGIFYGRQYLGWTFPDFGDVRNRDTENVIINGTFAADTDWTKGTGWTIAGDVAVATAVTTGTLVATVPPLAGGGQKYAISFSAVVTSGDITIFDYDLQGRTISVSGTYEFIFTSDDGSFGFMSPSGSFTGTIGNVSAVKVKTLGGVLLAGDAGEVLTSNGAGTEPSYRTAAVTLPAAADMQIQFNDGGAFGGSADLTWDDTSKIMTINGSIKGILDNSTPGLAGSDISIQSGIGYTTGDGGNLQLLAGQGGATGGGGNNFVKGGDAGLTYGNGGALQLNAGISPTSGNGGKVEITGGSGGATDGNGGNVEIVPGVAYGIGTDGLLKLVDPTSGKAAVLDMSDLTASDKTFTFPDKSGTFALTSDIHPDFDTLPLVDSGASGSYYVGGFYNLVAAKTTLTIGGTVTRTMGTALDAKAARAICVVSGASAGATVLTVTGISIDDNGTRNDTDTEVLIADCSAISANDFFQSSKKWLGQITYTLSGGTGGDALSFNYGFIRSKSNCNTNFTLKSLVFFALGGATDTGINLELIHHKLTGWTYNASAFTYPTANRIIMFSTDYGTNTRIASGTYINWRRSNLSTAIAGATGGEGYVVRLTTTANNSIRWGYCRMGFLTT